MDQIQAELNGENFIWTDAGWCNASTFMAPPSTITTQLDFKYLTLLEEQDKEISDREELLNRSTRALIAKQFRRAWKILLRIWNESEQEDFAVLSKMSSLLRESNRPQEALNITEEYKDKRYSAIITSRAAAMCDLYQWEDAKKEIGRALAIGGCEESFLVVKRIKVARADLYGRNEKYLR